MARPMRELAASGWSLPRAFSLIASARLWSASASAYLPCSSYTMARLMTVTATPGWSVPRPVSWLPALVERVGVGVLALLLVHDGQTDEGGGRIGVVCAARLLLDRQRALVERLGLGVLALLLVHDGQVVDGRGHVGVVCAERLLLD